MPEASRNADGHARHRLRGARSLWQSYTVRDLACTEELRHGHHVCRRAAGRHEGDDEGTDREVAAGTLTPRDDAEARGLIRPSANSFTRSSTVHLAPGRSGPANPPGRVSPGSYRSSEGVTTVAASVCRDRRPADHLVVPDVQAARSPGTAHTLRRSKASIKAGSSTRTSRMSLRPVRFHQGHFVPRIRGKIYLLRGPASTIARKSSRYLSSMRSGMPTKLSGKASSNRSSRSWTTGGRVERHAERRALLATASLLTRPQRGPCGSQVRDRVLPAARRRGLAPRRGSRHGSAK